MKKGLGVAAMLVLCAVLGWALYRYVPPLLLWSEQKLGYVGLLVDLGLLVLYGGLGYALGLLAVKTGAAGSRVLGVLCALLGGAAVTVAVAVRIWGQTNGWSAVLIIAIHAALLLMLYLGGSGKLE